MRKEIVKRCKECNTEFKTTEYRKKFCNHRCSALYSNKHRLPPTEETKAKQSNSLKKYYIDHPELKNPAKIKYGSNYSEMVGNSTKDKFKGDKIKSILDVSKRTSSKILKRMNLGCCLCGWKEAACDIHHINGRRIEDANGHWNLTYICPNHHRKAHSNLINKTDFISLDKYFPENWRDYYYG